MLIQIVIIIFICFVLAKLFFKLKDKEISSREALSWSIFWIIVFAAALWPKNLDRLAQFFGVYRGVDLAIYLSIIILFYLVFRILTKLTKIERNIIKIVREISLKEKKDG